MLCLEDKISMFMQCDPPVVSLYDDLLIIQDLFSRHGNSHILVLNEKIPVGIISLSDLMYQRLDEVLPSKSSKEISRSRQSKLAMDIMSKNIISLRVNETVRKALEIFSMKAFHALPIVNEMGEACGILTLDHLLHPMQKSV